jgi:cytochrome b561
MAFTLQGFGPFLHWLTLVILCVLPVIIGTVLYKIGGLPGSIAATRGHPQAAAINVCGWMGLVTLVLWPIAMVWAHLDRVPASEESPTASRSVSGKLQQASQRLAALEAGLTKTTAPRGG